MRHADVQVGGEYALRYSTRGRTSRVIVFSKDEVSAGGQPKARVRRYGEGTATTPFPVSARSLLCRWEDLPGFLDREQDRMANRADAQTASDQLVRERCGKLIAQLELLGFEQDQPDQFKVRYPHRGRQLVPEFTVSWEVLLRLIDLAGIDLDADPSVTDFALDDLFGAAVRGRGG